MKTFRYEKAKTSLPWVKDVSKGLVVFIGLAEVFGAIGLILPAATDIVPSLTPIAAAGLALTMLFAAIFHARRKENQAIGMNVILLLFSAFIAYGHWFA